MSFNDLLRTWRVNLKNAVALAAYVLAAGAITFYYFDAGEIFLGVAAPFLSGILLGVVTGFRVVFYGLVEDDVRAEIWIAVVLITAPILWYLAFGCVFGCLA